MGVKEVFVALERLGTVNVVLPFVIIFIIVYALLEKVKLFKDNKVNVVLAVLLAFISIAAADVVRNVNLFSYYLVLAVLAGVCVLIFVALLGGKLDFSKGKSKEYFKWGVTIGLCILVFYGLYMAGLRIDVGPFSYNFLRFLIPLVLTVLVFALIVWYVSSPSETEEEQKQREAEEAQKQKVGTLPDMRKMQQRAAKALGTPEGRSAPRGELPPNISEEEAEAFAGKTEEEKIKFLKEKGLIPQ